ncbi:MAG: pyridoxal phosphate-dependent aminotransferase [Planctomycetota bacterium]
MNELQTRSWVSGRVSRLKPSATLAVAAKAAAMRADGIDVLSFAAGEPDFDTPEAIKAAAVQSLGDGRTKYAPVPGDVSTRERLAQKLRDENGLASVTADHIVITAGGKQALQELMAAILDPGDEVLLPEPAWVSYRPQAELAEATVVGIPTTAANDFKASANEIEAAITERSKVLILNSPSNPCGTMYSEAELRAIAAVVERHPQLLVISDEIYEKLVFGELAMFSIGSVDSIADRVITVNGLSKAYSMTGWRIGYLAGQGETGLQIAAGVKKLQSQSTTAIPSFFFAAIETAIDECDQDVEQMRLAFAKRGELMHGRLSSMAGVVCPKPTGAFYCFPDVSSYFGKRSKAGTEITDGQSFAEALLGDQHVACVPGNAFGKGGEKCVRWSFACSEAQILAGMDKLEAFLASLA